MSFLARLTLDGKQFDLLQCVSEIEQKIDAKGQAVSSVRGGDIRLIINGSEDDTIPSWASDKTKKMDGDIVFYKWDMESKFKEIEFKDGYITWFCESFMADDDEDMNFSDALVYDEEGDEELFEMVRRAHEQFKSSYLMVVKISSKSVTVDGVEHNNGW